MKKALSLLWALVMCLSLWACSEDVPDTTTNSTENDITISGTDTTPSPSEDATVPSTTEPTTPPTETEPTTPPTETEPTAPPTETEPPATEPPTTAPTEDNTEKQARYEHALTLLEASTTDYTDPSALVKEAYDILSELGGYKDADKYQQRITIIPDVCLRITKTNTFGEVTSQFPRGYDAQGRLIWCDGHKKGGIQFYTYDEQNRITSQTLKYRNGETWSIETYQYDDAGNLVGYSNVVSRGDGYSELHEYEEAGRRIQTITTTASGNEYVSTYEYNKAGRLIKYIYTNGYNEYKYDDFGNRIEYIAISDDRINWKETYSYDEAGNLVKLARGYWTDWNYKSYHEDVTEYSYDDGRIISEKDYSIDYWDTEIEHISTPDEYKYVYGDYYCYTPAA